MSIRGERFEQPSGFKFFDSSSRALLAVLSVPPGARDLWQREDLHAPGEYLEDLPIARGEGQHQGGG